jgi:hypothetical protein
MAQHENFLDPYFLYKMGWIKPENHFTLYTVILTNQRETDQRASNRPFEKVANNLFNLLRGTSSCGSFLLKIVFTFF